MCTYRSAEVKSSDQFALKFFLNWRKFWRKITKRLSSFYFPQEIGGFFIPPAPTFPYLDCEGWDLMDYFLLNQAWLNTVNSVPYWLWRTILEHLTKMKGSSYNIFCKLNSLYVEIRRKITSQARANLTLRTQFFTPGSKITHPIGHAKCAPDRAWSRSNWKQCFRFLITQSRICGFQYYISIESFRN